MGAEIGHLLDSNGDCGSKRYTWINLYSQDGRIASAKRACPGSTTERKLTQLYA